MSTDGRRGHDRSPMREEEGTRRRKGAKTQRAEPTENELSRIIVDAVVEMHRVLGGPRLLESVYEEALVHELELRAVEVERQRTVPVVYKGRRLGNDLRLDLVVGRRVLVECKAASSNNPLFCAHGLTYPRLTGLRLAIVVSFGEEVVKNGIHRVVNKP